MENNQIENKRWWFPSLNGKKRIMWCGTHPIQTNGYSRVMYYISKYLGKYKDIELTVYGFQNFNHFNGQDVIRGDIPKNVVIHDAYASEDPKRSGFGEKEIGDYIKKHPQDIIIIFNDAIITTSLTATIINECGNERHRFKLVSYMDQVYRYQKKEYIQLLNTFYDAIIAFTPYWKEIAYKIGIKKSMPIYVFPHGIDHKLYYPIDQKIARYYFNYNQDDFMFLNLNRNQPRKQWDINIIAWVEFVERHYHVNITKKLTKNDCKINKHTSRPVKLVVGTTVDGYWNLADVIESEVKFRDVPLDYVKNTIISVPNPQSLSDRDINILYNACDAGINPNSGEGFGLCTFEHMALGKPQIATYVGGIREYLNENISTIIKPSMYLYLDNKSNGIGGIAELGNPSEFAEAFWKYLSNPELVEKQGYRGRQHILTNYKWENLVDYLYNRILLNL